MLKREFKIGEWVAFPAPRVMEGPRWRLGVVCKLSKEGQVTARMENGPEKFRKAAFPHNEDCADQEEVRKVEKAYRKFQDWMHGFVDRLVFDEEERLLLKMSGLYWILSAELINHLRVPLTQRGLCKLLLELTALRRNEGIYDACIDNDPVADPYLLDRDIGMAEWDYLSKREREGLKLRLRNDREDWVARLSVKREDVERKKEERPKAA